MSLPSSFDMPTDGRTDRHFVSFFDKGSGPYAAPHACRAHSHVTPQPFVPQTNILLRFCYPYAFISHVWTPFHGCRANLRSFAFCVDLMNLKHQLYLQRCLDIAGSIEILWMGPFVCLSHFCDLACEPAFQGRISRTRKFVHMSSELSDTFLWPHGFDLAQLNDPHGFRA